MVKTYVRDMGTIDNNPLHHRPARNPLFQSVEEELIEIVEKQSARTTKK